LRPPRALHHFPTRRSSDLIAWPSRARPAAYTQTRACGKPPADLRARKPEVVFFEKTVGHGRMVVALAPRVYFRTGWVGLRQRSRDRTLGRHVGVFAATRRRRLSAPRAGICGCHFTADRSRFHRRTQNSLAV